MKCNLNQGRLPEYSGALHLKIFNAFNELISNLDIKHDEDEQ